MEPDGDNDGEFEGSSSSTTSPEELPVTEKTPSPLRDQEPVSEASGAVGVEQASSSNAQEGHSSSQPQNPAVRYTSVEDMRENLLREGRRLTDAECNYVIEGLAPGSERYKWKQQRDGENRWPTAK